MVRGIILVLSLLQAGSVVIGGTNHSGSRYSRGRLG